MFDRRQFFQFATATAGLAVTGFSGAAMAQQSLTMGPATPFSYEGLKKQAREMAAQPYVPPVRPSPEVLDQIDYDAHGKLKFKTDLALWANGPSEFPVTFFHLGRYFQKPVRMHVTEKGQAREILYDNAYFEMPADSPARKLPDNSGFAGFRFQEARNGKLDWRKNDWVAFLGASYFRAIGELYQYGLSARGLAVDVAVFGKNEEFPDFTHVYFDTPAPGSDTVTVYALLDGPSVAGVYRFVMQRAKSVIMAIESTIFLRQDVARLGIAPLTSMYWYSEKSKATAVDWRPEIHDSDGLAMWTGTGERIWRPLNNPPRIITSSFSDTNPKGFGLLQRDRNFDHYLDGVYYDRRPSLWIEPTGNWERGAIQLVEIPTDDEIHDNVVAMWVPAEPAVAGKMFEFKYRMYWSAEEPYPTPLARVVATRFGNGGQAGTARPKGVRKFMVEFMGEPLTRLPKGVIPQPVLTASRGTFANILTEAVPDDVPGHWRTQFDLTAAGLDPVELRCYLRQGDEILSETWLYQYHPVA
ncbi:glucan biosynthesis protein [Microvirga antarctica]|uniref:glucan biosynthesis protein n=1 Tax=Microvirga antarctica TaxID=2819233 RepID=UPI001B30ACD9|nr:glucan biosynthesis protein D [Microvirga antarctica]